MPTPESPDPQGVLDWINAVSKTFSAAYVAVGVPLAGFIAWAVNTAASRKDKRAKREEDARDDLAEEQREAFTRLRAEVAELRAAAVQREKEHRAEIDTLEARIRVLTALVQRWYDIAHEIWHRWASTITVANRFLEKAQLEPVPEVAWPPRASHEIDKPGYMRRE